MKSPQNFYTLLSVSSSRFQRDCLKTHNDYRSFHHAPPLNWSAELTRDAQDWANYLAAPTLFKHNPTELASDQGENVCQVMHPKRLCNDDEKDRTVLAVVKL